MEISVFSFCLLVHTQVHLNSKVEESQHMSLDQKEMTAVPVSDPCLHAKVNSAGAPPPFSTLLTIDSIFLVEEEI